MVHGEVARLKNGELVMAGVLEEDHIDNEIMLLRAG